MSTTQISGSAFPSSPIGSTTPSTKTPWEYAAAFAIYATVMIAWVDAGSGEVPTALAWLVFIGAITVWWNPLSQHLGALTGVQLGSVPSTGRPTL